MPTPREIAEGLAEIGENIRTQDNRITAIPIFIVQQVRREYGYDTDYTDGDGIVWLNDGYEHDLNSEEGRRMEELYESCQDIPSEWTRTAYQDHWEFVTACFTEKGCKDYIAVNGHNLKKPRIYVASGYRNAEWKLLRDFLSTANELHTALSSRDREIEEKDKALRMVLDGMWRKCEGPPRIYGKYFSWDEKQMIEKALSALPQDQKGEQPQ